MNWIARNNSIENYYRPNATFDVCCHSAYHPRGSEGLGDANYCVVNAVAAAFNIVWSEAHALLAQLGRKKRHGFHTWRLANSTLAKRYGEIREAKWFYRGPRSWRAAMTVASFLKIADPQKRYILTVRGHAFAVIGGKVRGEDKLTRRVKVIYEVIPHLQRPGAINLPVPVKKKTI